MSIAYADSDGVSIAYEVVGGSGPDVILMPPIGTRAASSSVPIFRLYYEGLARFCRLVIYDRRGMGMSDAWPEAPTLDQHVADLDAVRRAVGAEAVFLTTAHVGSACLFAYCLAHPERVSGLVLMNGFACDAVDPEGTVGSPPLIAWDIVDRVTGANFDAFLRAWIARGLPEADDAGLEPHVQYYKAALTPSTFRKQLAFARGFDHRDRLSEIRTPTLVIHSTAPDAGTHGRYLRDRLPNARALEIDSESSFPWAEADPLREILRGYEEFLSGRVLHSAGRTFAALVVTDIVDSTAQQARRGDAEWRVLRERFEQETLRLVGRRDGEVVQFLGDGALARFALPSDALRVARSLVAAAREIGVEIRVGVHAAEAEIHGRELSGIGVNVVARIASVAVGGEVLASTTLRDLVEGAGFPFGAEREVELKGLGRRRVVPLGG